MGDIKPSLLGVVGEDPAAELSTNLSGVKKGACTVLGQEHSMAVGAVVVTALCQEQVWGVGRKPRRPQWLEWKKQGGTCFSVFFLMGQVPEVMVRSVDFTPSDSSSSGEL